MITTVIRVRLRYQNSLRYKLAKEGENYKQYRTISRTPGHSGSLYDPGASAARLCASLANPL